MKMAKMSENSNDAHAASFVLLGIPEKPGLFAHFRFHDTAEITQNDYSVKIFFKKFAVYFYTAACRLFDTCIRNMYKNASSAFRAAFESVSSGTVGFQVLIVGDGHIEERRIERHPLSGLDYAELVEVHVHKSFQGEIGGRFIVYLEHYAIGFVFHLSVSMMRFPCVAGKHMRKKRARHREKALEKSILPCILSIWHRIISAAAKQGENYE